jgi:hypothetical protein
MTAPADPPSAGFGPWSSLSEDRVAHDAPDAPGAVQLRRADGMLIRYPRGRSAMVFYFYAARSVREALKRVFRDELDEPGSRGEGPLEFRVLPGGQEARVRLEQLYEEFDAQFGRPPVLHLDDDAYD